MGNHLAPDITEPLNPVASGSDPSRTYQRHPGEYERMDSLSCLSELGRGV